MNKRHLTSMAAAISAVVTLAACGGSEDERLSDAEFSKQMNPIVQQISREFGSVFQELGEADEGDRVPAGVRTRLAAAAKAERDAIADVADIEPPERAEAAFEKLERGANAQADQLEELAGQRNLTVGRMADALEGGEAAEALRELAEGGFIEPPPGR